MSVLEIEMMGLLLLIAVGILYCLWRGLRGFWKSTKGGKYARTRPLQHMRASHKS